MASPSVRFPTLLQREFREYRTSMLWTPLAFAGVMAALMLASILLVNRVGLIGDTILEALMADGAGRVELSVRINDDSGATVIEGLEPQEGEGPAAALPERPAQASVYEVVPEAERSEEQWNFSREWTFNPEPAERSVSDDGGAEEDEIRGRELNVMLSVLHGILTLILFLTTANYLLGSLHEDRKDRSILFWRSMPVTEAHNVAAKLATALVGAPLIYLVISIALQVVYVVLMCLLVWRLERDPFAIILSNIDFPALFLDPISGWFMTALLIAPAYAWLLLASAFARRSPLGIALGVPIGLYLIERLFLGTEYVGNAITAHFPHVDDDSAVGFYLFGPRWTGMDLGSLAGGLVFTALALVGTVWLRTHRWELN